MLSVICALHGSRSVLISYLCSSSRYRRVKRQLHLIPDSLSQYTRYCRFTLEVTKAWETVTYQRRYLSCDVARMTLDQHHLTFFHCRTGRPEGAVLFGRGIYTFTICYWSGNSYTKISWCPDSFVGPAYTRSSISQLSHVLYYTITILILHSSPVSEIISRSWAYRGQ